MTDPTIDELIGLSPVSQFTADDLSDIGVMPNLITIDLDNINEETATEADKIVKGLAEYFIDQQYIQEHPYIPTKIKTEVDVIRRTLKMLKTNEQAQDALIQAISLDPAKAALFSSLTSLQNTAGSLHKQLTEHIEELENIFQKIEDSTERTFAVQDKEDSDEGCRVNRGAKELIKMLKGEI